MGEGRLDLTAAANFNRTEITKTPGLPTITSLPQPTFLFDRQARLTIEEGTPDRKIVLSSDWSQGPWGATAKVTNYADVILPQNSLGSDQHTGDATLLDLEARYEFPMGLEVALGVNNVLDEYPSYTPGVINSPTTTPPAG